MRALCMLMEDGLPRSLSSCAEVCHLGSVSLSLSVKGGSTEAIQGAAKGEMAPACGSGHFDIIRGQEHVHNHGQ